MQLGCYVDQNVNIFAEVATTSDGVGFYAIHSVYRVVPNGFSEYLNNLAPICFSKLVNTYTLKCLL